MFRRFALPLFFILTCSIAALAQAPGDGRTEPEYPDSTYYPEDSSYYDPEPVMIDTAFGGMDVDAMPSGPGSFGPGGGFFIGPTFEVTSLSPGKLDRDLDGDLVLYGVQVYGIISGW